MKTTKRTVSIEIPASIAAAIGGLDDLRTLHPPLVDAERELADATAQLETTRDDLQRQRDHVEQLAIGSDAVAHAAAFHRWQASKSRVAPIEARVQRAQAALQEAKQHAAAAALEEARRRHEVILRAAQQLAGELKGLQALEDALNQRVGELPQATYGGGMNHVGGSIREVAVVTASAV